MTAYYNEIEPFAVEWLRNLINKGLIADGIVDDRSIASVAAADLGDFTQCHFFAGIGIWSHALRLAGWRDDEPVWTGSCPCQPFSAAGKGKGVEDHRHLWPEFYRLIAECRPAVVFGEQVASKDGLGWLDAVFADLEGSGYAAGAVDLCAAGLGAPHIRQRLWFVGERLDDTAGARHLGALVGAEREARDEARLRLPGERRGVNRLADAQCERLEGRVSRHREEHGEDSSRVPSYDARHGAACRVGNPDGPRSAARIPEQMERESGFADEPDNRVRGLPGSRAGQPQPRGLADSIGNGRRESGHGDHGRDDRPQLDANGRDDRPRPTNGHWRATDWLHCRDGKWRPVEPGTFPLAHGATSRVGRLRAYGNAIVPQAAAEVIAAFMECRP